MTLSDSLQSTLRQFEAARDDLPGGGLAWLARRRADGLDRFTGSGLPTRKVEAWKYTDLAVLRDTAFEPGADAAAEVGPIGWLGGDDGVRLVFVNGRFRADLSRLDNLPAGLRLGSVADLLKTEPDLMERLLGQVGALDEQPLPALNAAFMADGFVLRLDDGVAVETPIEIAFVGGETGRNVASHPRNLIVVGDGAQATLVEHAQSVGDGATFANAVTEVEVGDGATFRHCRVQEEGLGAVTVSTLRARVGRDGTYENFTMTTGGGLTRNEALISLVGEGAHCGYSGAYLLGGKQHCDNTSRIEHLVPNTTCREVFHGVLDDTARAVFQGKLFVAKDAQKTDGYQLSKAVLLSDTAEVDAKPELEIYADDVRCSHGATAGDIDHEALFYLRSRGLPEAIAQRLLIEGFVGEVLEEFSDEAVREALTGRVNGWLAATARRIAA